MTIISKIRAALRRRLRRLAGLAGASETSAPGSAPRPVPPGAAAPGPARRRHRRGRKAGVAGKAAAAQRPRARIPAVATAARPWSLLFLGGSNTLMRLGYSQALVACLADRMGPPAKVTNLAVGAGSSAHGLMIAKTRPDLADHDVIVVEYGVNDVKLSQAGGIDVWRGAAEGMLRHILAARPDARVVFPLFARRDMKPSQFQAARELVDLAAHYGRTHSVRVADIDHLLRDVLFPEAAEFNALYEDKAHFRRPLVARLVGAITASELMAAQPGAGAPLPDPVHPWNFAGAEVVDLARIGRPADRSFVNSRYDVPARRIGIGEALTVDLPGAIAAIEFVSLTTAATLIVAEEGQPAFAMHTRHTAIGKGGKFNFLVRCQAIEGRSWAAGGGGPRQVTLRARVAAGRTPLVPAYNMQPAASAQAEAVYVTRLLCVP